MKTLGVALCVALIGIIAGSYAALASAADAQEPAPLKTLNWQIAAAGQEHQQLSEAVRTTDAILSSVDFWRDFAVIAGQYPQIFVGPEYRQPGMADGMANAVGAANFLRTPDSRYRVFDTMVTLTGTYYAKGIDYVGACARQAGTPIYCRATAMRQNYSNELVVTHGLGPDDVGLKEPASIEVGRVVFKRYLSASKVEKSCTFNSLAHEWTHTIGLNAPKHWAITVDGDTNKPDMIPFLSQLVGSAAQCNWLQSNKLIGQDDAALNACAARFGVEYFQNSQCI